MDQISYAKLRRLIAETHWTKSKTYKPPYDHEYVMKQKHPELCDLLARAIREDGYDRSFHGQPHRYLNLDGWRYWHYELVYNRDVASKVLPE